MAKRTTSWADEMLQENGPEGHPDYEDAPTVRLADLGIGGRAVSWKFCPLFCRLAPDGS